MLIEEFSQHLQNQVTYHINIIASYQQHINSLLSIYSGMFYSPLKARSHSNSRSCSKHATHRSFWSYLNQMNNNTPIQPSWLKQNTTICKTMQIQCNLGRGDPLLLNYVVSVFSCHFNDYLTYTINMQNHYSIVDMLLDISILILAFNLIKFRFKSKPQQESNF